MATKTTAICHLVVGHVNIVRCATDGTPVRWYTVQADAIVEAKLKTSDVSCALVVCSLIRQRYADFSALLLESWQKVLLTKKDDKVGTTSRLCIDCRCHNKHLCEPSHLNSLQFLVRFLISCSRDCLS